MQNKQKKYLTWLIGLFLLFTFSWLAISRFYDQQVLSQHESFLKQKADSFIRLTKNHKNDFAEIATDYVQDSEERITYLNHKGEILFDTFDPKLVGNRSARPEIKAVLEGNAVGKSLRKSPTLNKEMLYVAIPVNKNGQLKEMIRLSEPTSAFLPEAKKIKQAIFLVNFTFWLILTLLILGILRKQNRPVETILPVIKKIIAEPKEQRVILQDSSEWQELYHAINVLSAQMSDTYQAFSTTEKHFYTLLNDLMVGIFIIDEEQLIFANETFKKQLSLPRLFLKKPYAMTLTDPQFIQLIYQAPQTELVRKKIRTETERLLDVTLRSFKEDGQLIGITYDLTRVAQLEKLQNDFVGNVSHELKTPVTSLIGFTETLLDGAKEDPETLDQFLKIMQKDAYRLKNLVEEILLLSKTGDRDYPLKNVDLSSLIKQMINNYRQSIQEKSLVIEVDGPSHLNFRTKEELLLPILKNLIENAIRYCSDKGKIRILLKKEKQHILLSVTDNGVGIAPAEQKRVFERFYRVDKDRSRNSGGTGLGLAIVKDYSEQLGGSIQLESQVGQGSTFTVTFPL